MEETTIVSPEMIESKRIDALRTISEKLLSQRETIIYNLDSDDISEETHEIFLEATDILLSVIVLGIGGKDFDDKVTNDTKESLNE